MFSFSVPLSQSWKKSLFKFSSFSSFSGMLKSPSRSLFSTDYLILTSPNCLSRSEGVLVTQGFDILSQHLISWLKSAECFFPPSSQLTSTFLYLCNLCCREPLTSHKNLWRILPGAVILCDWDRNHTGAKKLHHSSLSLLFSAFFDFYNSAASWLWRSCAGFQHAPLW